MMMILMAYLFRQMTDVPSRKLSNPQICCGSKNEIGFCPIHM